MAKIKINATFIIPSKGKECGDCPFCRFSVWTKYDWKCLIFNKQLKEKDYVQFRCKMCLEAEVKK